MKIWGCGANRYADDVFNTCEMYGINDLAAEEIDKEGFELDESWMRIKELGSEV